jgi:hypothetical protein
MIARSHAVVAAGGRLASLACQPPLTLRQVGPTEPGTCALCLVGTAAGPLAGDDLTLRLEVLDGARATLQATGAAIAQGRAGGAAAALRIEAVLDAGATLCADPGPLIVRAGGRIDARVEIDLGPGARAEWRELIVLGSRGPGRDLGRQPGPSGQPGPAAQPGPSGQPRPASQPRPAAQPGPAGQPSPAATLRWDVTRGGAPLLRQLVD